MTAANVQPIYTVTPHIDSGQARNSGTVLGPSANTAEDGTGNNTYGVFYSGAQGSYVQSLRLVPVLSPSATKLRLWYCSNTSSTFTGGTTNSATNMVALQEVSLPTVTVSLTVQGAAFNIALGFTMPANTWLAVTFETSTGSSGTGWAVGVLGGDY